MRFGQWLGLICLVISLIVLWEIRQMLLLIFASIVLATALNSLARQFQRLGIHRRWLALAVTLMAVLFCSSLFVALVVPPFVNQFRLLLLRLPFGFDLVIRRIELFLENPPQWMPELDLPNLELPDLGTLTQQLQPIVSDILQNFFEFFNSSLTVVLQLLLVLVLTLMLLANPSIYRQAAITLFPAFYRRRADGILAQCEVALGNWLGGIIANSLFVATMSGVGLNLLGIDLVLAHALLAGLLNFIPNIGPALSVVFPLSIALSGPLWKVIAVVALYVLIQNLESYWVSPAVMAKQVALLPAVTLSAQVFFATFFGLTGLILALPLTVVAKTWIKEALVKDILDRCGSPRQIATPRRAPVASDTEERRPPTSMDPQIGLVAPSDGEPEPHG